jgi:hypothetical protein
VEIIHMNGRVYDYNVGRFLSVDPFIKDAGNSQAINPYSYVLNNPLNFTDPTGYLYEPGDRGAAAGLAVSVATGLTSEQDARTLEAVDAASPFGGGLAGSTDLGVGVKEFLATLAITGSVTVASEVLSNVDLSKRRRGNNGSNSNVQSSGKTTDIGSRENTKSDEVYHGTDNESANSIMTEGLSVRRNQNADSLADESGFSVTSDRQEAIDMAVGKTALRNHEQGRNDLKPAVLKAKKSDLPQMRTHQDAELGETFDNANESKIPRSEFKKVGPNVFKSEASNVTSERGGSRFQSNRIGTKLIKRGN